MKDLGIVQSTEKPSDVDIRETKVFVASDIKEVHEKKTDEQPGFDGLLWSSIFVTNMAKILFLNRYIKYSV